VLPGFLFNPAEKYNTLDGLTEICYEKNPSIRIIFMDNKKKETALSPRTQRVIKKVVEEKAAGWDPKMQEIYDHRLS